MASNQYRLFSLSLSSLLFSPLQVSHIYREEKGDGLPLMPTPGLFLFYNLINSFFSLTQLRLLLLLFFAHHL
jgi:hypothetical protein